MSPPGRGENCGSADYLRSHHHTCAEYARLKHCLAERFRWDRDAYTQAKTAFIEDILYSAGTSE